jgi:putative N6-adenine-specific DNA methylase
MRIDQFKASSFRQIEKKVAEIPWELYLPSDLSPQINAKTHHCRLYHSDAIGERFSNGILSHKRNASPEGESGKSCEQTVFIRGVDDRFTVSIDSSGDHLHKRGLKKHPGQAPLRETTAAAALLLAGYRGQKPLIDPMCGTGTFSLEAAMMARDIPAGWFRQFAFMGWPSFRRAQWEYLKSRFEPNFNSDQAPLIFASDKDPAACAHLEKSLTQRRLSEVIKVFQQDFFNFLPKDLTDQTGLVVINPPYGRRLENRSKSDQLFMKICTRLMREYMGWKLVLISPNKKLTQKVPFKLTKHPISHGGLRPVMMIGTIK